MNNFITIKPGEITENTFKLIAKDWMLITAGSEKSCNTMTASWGGMGILWNKKVVFIFIRPQRYTYGFLENNDVFTLSFFGEEHRDVLNFCGAHSGRDVDKIKETGLTVRGSAGGSVYFDEARLVIECRKIYYQDIDPEKFLVEEIERNYADNDYHRMYIGEITGCYTVEKT